MRRLLVSLVCCLSLIGLTTSEPVSQTDPTVGLRDNTPKTHALINARIVQAPGRVIERGTVVVRDGTIEAVGADVKIPADARVWDYEGLTIYAGLIDMYTHVGLQKEKKKGEDEEIKGAPYWNEQIVPQRDALESFFAKDKDLEAMRELGFTAALVVPDRGAIRGHSAVVTLGESDANDREIKPHATQTMTMVYQRAPGRSDSYPTSLMGQIALVRQAFLDAQWYAAAQRAFAENPNQARPETNDALAALAADLDARTPVLCEVDGDLSVARAQRIAAEFNLDLWYRGNGNEYKAIDLLKAANANVIVPMDFPKDPEVDSPESALDVSLSELQHWEAAPANAAALEKAKVRFALTTHGLDKKKTFHAEVAKAIKRGLSSEAALAATTTTPAAMLGLDKTLGTIDKGKNAHLVVAEGELFTKDTKIVDVWIDGEHHEVNPRPEFDPRGKWELALKAAGLDQTTIALEIKGEMDKLKGTLSRDSTEVSCKTVALDYQRLTVTFPGKDFDVAGVVRLTGAVEGERLTGQGELPNGEWFSWSAAKVAKKDDAKTDEDDEEAAGAAAESVAASIGRSLGAFGLESIPDQPQHVLVRNTTIWTSGPQGRLQDADLLITEGKVAKIGQGLKAPGGALVIDGRGKHVTPGLIDCHSHSGASGSVNESGQAVSAEVEIASVIDPYDIALYRELAGGLTIANVLHGSANPIGGQNAVIKLRWGGTADDMLMDDVMPGIKFALGENVKQSNWGDEYASRYPQTRMGVEQLIRDRFQAARDYEAEWQGYKKKKGTIPPRRDLELETLLQVLNGERLVHCHSYRQDEILMLVRVADDFGFTIGTFQHVLEGYKVAEALAAHGAGASTFSDWWAYKFEVYDAIPYNGALMHDQGVVVSFNSDSDELARRMNSEAAKAVAYGGVREEEALKFVTLNPAIQLRIDDRVGSLEVGKDGDFVIWSGSPLSTYSICEQTWIDGRRYFDIDADREMRIQVTAERARLMQKVLASGDKKSKKDMKDKPGASN